MKTTKNVVAINKTIQKQLNTKTFVNETDAAFG